jgi:hypothetical protein
VFLINSCLDLFTAAPFHRHPFSRTYGVNLPSSLTMLLPFVLGFSPHLPVSVCGTGTFNLDSGFSCQCGISYFGTYFPSPSGLRNVWRICLLNYLLPLNELFQHSLNLSSCVPTSLKQCIGGTGISTCCPSPTLFSLSLGPDLPWEDDPSPGNLRFSTVKILTLLSLLIPAFSLLFRPHVLTIMLLPTDSKLPYHVHYCTSVASVHSFSPGNLRRRFTRLVSYYALFK